MNTLAAGTAPRRRVPAFLTQKKTDSTLGPRSGTALFETARPTFQRLAFREKSGFFPRSDRRFESLFLQQRVHQPSVLPDFPLGSGRLTPSPS
jgi:hypothetical protein